MKARSIARELAVFALFQAEKKGEKLVWEKLSLQEQIVDTVRALESLAEEQLETVTHKIAAVKETLLDHELDHPDNEHIPHQLPTVAVPIPTTHDMQAQLDTLLSAVQNLQEALYLPEVKALSEREDVQNYCMMLVRSVTRHQDEIDAKIEEAAQDWRVDRMHKMDLVLLRMAVSELLYVDSIDAATVIDESLELAKRFTDEESRKFIHGVLGQIAKTVAEVPGNV